MAELIQATKVYYLTVEGFVTGDPPLLNLRRVAGHNMRERDMYVFRGGDDLERENGDACADTLMNGHWEELIGKVEELLHATDDPDYYCMHIRAIIQYSSDGRQRLKSFLRLHVIKRVQSRRFECEWLCTTLVDFQQQLVKRADWIYPYVWSYENRPMNSRSIVNEAFDQALSDLDAVNAQVIMSVSQGFTLKDRMRDSLRHGYDKCTILKQFLG